jgi:hypothetical protein
VVKNGFLLLLDQFLEGADRLRASDVYWKDVARIIATNGTVEFEFMTKGS